MPATKNDINSTDCLCNLNSLEMCAENSQNFNPSASIQGGITFLIEQLANDDRVLCKSQQKDETDISKEEKINILTEIYEKSKPTFLSRFGFFLNADQITFFEPFKDDPKDGYEISYYLKSILKMHSKRNKLLKNRRYAALKQLEKDSYFSENEMRKRNPLLYEQLVGRYLSASERKLNERSNREQKTFVGVLMEGIENEETELKRRQQEEAEDAAKEEEEDDDDDEDDDDGIVNNEKDSSDSDSSNEDIKIAKFSGSRKRKTEKPSRSFWGEFTEEGVPKRIKMPLTDNELSITAQERKLLKEEFVNSMYESFLEGHDEDFDYSTVDNNDDYDNLEILANDEEEKYFDSEEPEDLTMEEDGKIVENKHDSSEDELDIYMSALNQHPAVCQLSENMKKL